MVSLLQLDVTDADFIHHVVETVQTEFGHLDILVNDAGISINSTNAIQNLRQTFEINVSRQMVNTEAFLPLLKKSSSSLKRVVYVSSDLGSVTSRTIPCFPTYRAPFPI
jgi:NAD(P)-dependent dehydrogenase (short-subunit alcohol dehydrogenase family)